MVIPDLEVIVDETKEVEESDFLYLYQAMIGYEGPIPIRQPDRKKTLFQSYIGFWKRT